MGVHRRRARKMGMLDLRCPDTLGKLSAAAWALERTRVPGNGLADDGSRARLPGRRQPVVLAEGLPHALQASGDPASNDPLHQLGCLQCRV